VVTRLAPSFCSLSVIRIFLLREQPEQLRQLADPCHPDALLSSLPAGGHPYLALLEQVGAEYCSFDRGKWRASGSARNVMNTDNMSILGLTIDYGPFGFIRCVRCRPYLAITRTTKGVTHTTSAAGRVLESALPWPALMPLTEDVDRTRAALSTYEDEFARAMEQLFHAKLGSLPSCPKMMVLIERVVALLHRRPRRLDRVLAPARHLKLDVAAASDDAPGWRDLFVDRAAFDAWTIDYRARLRAGKQRRRTTLCR